MEGRLTGLSVEGLRQSSELHTPSHGAQLTLDLADVSFADADGIVLLRDLETRNVSVVNLAPFLALQLRDPNGGKLSPRDKGDTPERNDQK